MKNENNQNNDIIDKYSTNGIVNLLPSKRSKRHIVLEYLSTKFENNRTYTEKEVNEILLAWHSFSDPELLRRELCVYGFLSRTRDGSEYKKNN